jgi:hypothetical protein
MVYRIAIALFVISEKESRDKVGIGHVVFYFTISEMEFLDIRLTKKFESFAPCY